MIYFINPPDKNWLTQKHNRFLFGGEEKLICCTISFAVSEITVFRKKAP